MAVNLFCMPKFCKLAHPKKREPHATQKQLYVQCSNSKSTVLGQPQPSDKRKSANYMPSTYSYEFLQSLKIDSSESKLFKYQQRNLEEELRGMIDVENNSNLMTVLETIDDIERLGLGHRFKDAITAVSNRYCALNCCDGKNLSGQSLHEAALSFRMLRQHGYAVSSDVFIKFMDQEGKFKTSILQDVKGLLSLYKATHLSFEGESLLDEAKAFAKTNFDQLGEVMAGTLLDEVSHELELPSHHRMRRLETRRYIDVYKKRQDKNHALLELAEIEFHMAQSELQADVKDLSRWWKDTGLANKLNFARDRLMECFFWSIGIVSQQHLKKCRMGLTKVAAFVTIIDDIYDVYGLLEELEQFTDAVERWDVNVVKDLPDYMKLCFLSLYNTVNEMAYDTLKEQGVYAIPYLRKAWADMCKAFLQEARWDHKKCRPTFKDYFENAWISSSGPLFLVHAYFLSNQNITTEALDSIYTYHDLMRWPSVIFRLCNDLVTSSAELVRGENVNAISCYMHDTGFSEEVAREYMKETIDKAWKNINSMRLDNTPFGDSFVEISTNLARISHCTYQYGDGHGDPDVRSKKRISALIIDPISVVEQSVSLH